MIYYSIYEKNGIQIFYYTFFNLNNIIPISLLHYNLKQSLQ